MCCCLDEDFESAVKALNGKLYDDRPKKKAAACADGVYVMSCLAVALVVMSSNLSLLTAFKLTLVTLYGCEGQE